MAPAEFGITLEDGWDEDQRQAIRDAATASLKAQGGVLEPQDLYLIEQEDNPDKAYMLIEAKSRQRKAEQQEQSMALQQQNADVQLDANKQAEMMKQQTLQLEQQAKQADVSTQMELLSHEYQLKMIYLKMEKGLDLTAQEQAAWDSLIQIRAKGNIELDKAKIAAQNKPKKVA
jgi:hypothetical protein